jgi:hypothetical protein
MKIVFVVLVLSVVFSPSHPPVTAQVIFDERQPPIPKYPMSPTPRLPSYPPEEDRMAPGYPNRLNPSPLQYRMPASPSDPNRLDRLENKSNL